MINSTSEQTAWYRKKFLKVPIVPVILAASLVATGVGIYYYLNFSHAAGSPFSNYYTYLESGVSKTVFMPGHLSGVTSGADSWTLAGLTTFGGPCDPNKSFFNPTYDVTKFTTNYAALRIGDDQSTGTYNIPTFSGALTSATYHKKIMIRRKPCENCAYSYATASLEDWGPRNDVISTAKSVNSSVRTVVDVSPQIAIQLGLRNNDGSCADPNTDWRTQIGAVDGKTVEVAFVSQDFTPAAQKTLKIAPFNDINADGAKNSNEPYVPNLAIRVNDPDVRNPVNLVSQNDLISYPLRVGATYTVTLMDVNGKNYVPYNGTLYSKQFTVGSSDSAIQYALFPVRPRVKVIFKAYIDANFNVINDGEAAKSGVLFRIAKYNPSTLQWLYLSSSPGYPIDYWASSGINEAILPPGTYRIDEVSRPYGWGSLGKTQQEFTITYASAKGDLYPTLYSDFSVYKLMNITINSTKISTTGLRTAFGSVIFDISSGRYAWNNQQSSTGTITLANMKYGTYTVNAWGIPNNYYQVLPTAKPYVFTLTKDTTLNYVFQEISPHIGP